MYTILLAGAGNIGSRHLQGATKSSKDLVIWVYDLSKDSLAVAKERFEQMPKIGKKEVHYVSSLDQVPNNIDVAIVATGSKPRASIVKQIVETKNVSYMLLEKFLFGKVSEYETIGSLLKSKNIKSWVNCPFRMFEGYKKLKNLLDHSNPIIASYGKGGNWGLCCNAIHYIDIFMYLTGANNYSIDLSNLEQTVIDSKRPGYIELIGELTIYTPNQDALTLQTSIDGITEQIIHIKNGVHIIDVDENENIIHFDGKTFPLDFTYQSGLTGRVIDGIIDKGNCELSSLEESSNYHTVFLSSIIPFVNKIKGWESDACPIT